MRLLHCPAGITLSRARVAGRALRRAGTLAAALLAAAAACASAAHAAGPTVAVAGDSILVTDHSAGPTTVRATRPDAVTHKPVVIGQYSDDASSYTPFSVNTTVPTSLRPAGDCWQKGALASAVTPDLQPGDTVTVTQAPPFGNPTSTSVPVTEAARQDAGPIPSCRDLAPFARNVVTGRPDRVAGGPIVLSGVAQPFATHVSVSATDGTVSTAPVAASPAQDGTWSATIPAAQVDRLASGQLRVAPVFEVPDVSTGATAQIAAGAPVLLSKSRTGGSSPSGRSGLGVVHVPGRIGLGFARRNGIRASFVVPAGARLVRVQLRRGGKTLMQRVVPAGKTGSRQTVRLRGPRLRRVLYRGRFRVAVSVGASRARLGAPVTRAIVIR
jgi:hypothetical protein